MLWALIYIVVLLSLWMFVEWCLKHEGFNKVPGPKGIFLLENALQFLMDPVKLFYQFRSLSNKYKNLYRLKLGPKKVIIVHNPEDIEIIISGVKNSTKGFLYRFIQPWLQEGLLLSDGPKWQHRRKILTPTFHFNILRHFCAILEESSSRLVLDLSSEVDKEKTNITSYIAEFTLNSICETAMGTKLDPDNAYSRRYKDAIHTLGTLLVHRSQRVWMYPDFIFSLTPGGRKQKELLQLLASFRDSVINKRRENENNNIQTIVLDDDDDNNDVFTVGKKKLAMLDLLLQAEKEGIIDSKGIGEEVDTFMFEGHDTTATALQFAFMLLANNPESQDKIVEECNEIYENSDRNVCMADLGKMKYLECCIKEALRLYPPVAFIMRKIDHELRLTNHDIPGGIDCAILIFDLHRRSDQFKDPLQFRPERFLVEPTWHPYAYLPFSAGPRNCIGQKFAMMEMKLAISTVLRRYRLLPVTRPDDVVFITDFILRPKDPLYVKFVNRY